MRSLPTLVLLPGMDGTGELFTPLLSAFGKPLKAQVIRYPVDQALGYPELVALVEQQLPATPFVVLGESFSGPIAIALAALKPPNLRGLVLCCTFARCPYPRLAVLKRLTRLLPLPRISNLAIPRLLLGSSLTHPLRDDVLRAVAQVEPAVIRRRLRAVLEIDVRARLDAVKVPVIYLRGARDWLVPQSAIAPIASRLPEMKIVTFDAPHGLLQASPTEAAAVIVSFLQETA